MLYQTIVVYQAKGGVAKTTHSLYVGTKLARAGMCVVLVDADSQCNLTNACRRRGGVAQTDKTLFDALRLAKAQMNAAIPCELIEQRDGGELRLIPGFSDKHKPICGAIADALKDGGLPYTLAMFKLVLHDIAEAIIAEQPQYDGRIVFLTDCNPGPQELNMLAVMSSDYLIAPSMCVVDAASAFNVLGEYAHEWHQRIAGQDMTVAPFNTIGPLRLPTFLGTIMAYEHKKIVAELESWDCKIIEIVGQFINTYTGSGGRYYGPFYCRIKPFEDFKDKSKTSGVLVYDLADESTEHGFKFGHKQRERIKAIDSDYNHATQLVMGALDIHIAVNASASLSHRWPGTPPAAPQPVLPPTEIAPVDAESPLVVLDAVPPEDVDTAPAVPGTPSTVLVTTPRTAAARTPSPRHSRKGTPEIHDLDGDALTAERLLSPLGTFLKMPIPVSGSKTLPADTTPIRDAPRYSVASPLKPKRNAKKTMPDFYSPANAEPGDKPSRKRKRDDENDDQRDGDYDEAPASKRTPGRPRKNFKCPICGKGGSDTNPWTTCDGYYFSSNNYNYTRECVLRGRGAWLHYSCAGRSKSYKGKSFTCHTCLNTSVPVDFSVKKSAFDFDEV